MGDLRASEPETIYAHKKIVSITNQVQQNIQFNLNNLPVERLALKLTDRQMHIFRQFYVSTKPKDIGNIHGMLQGKIHMNTIKYTIRDLEDNLLVKRITSDCKIAHTLGDKRYKFYMITPQGIKEYELQVKVRPRKIKSLNEISQQADKRYNSATTQ